MLSARWALVSGFAKTGFWIEAKTAIKSAVAWQAWSELDGLVRIGRVG